MLARLATTLLLIALLSGCVESADPGTDSVDPGSPPAGTSQTASSNEPAKADEASPGSAHGSPSRAESAVTVSRDGTKFVARKTVTLSNGFGGATQATVGLKTVNGDVDAADWTQSGYRTVASLSARADTEQQARDNLARLDVVHTDKLASGRLTLSTLIQFPPNVQGLAGDLAASLPAKPSYILSLESTNGDLDVDGLGGSSVSARTTNGGIGLAASFNSVVADTTNGGVGLDGTFNRGDVGTTNGDVTGTVRTTASGSWDVETTNGDIDLDFEGGPDHGFDVSGSCTNGSVDLDVAGSEAVGTQSRTSKHVRSSGFSGKAVQVTVDLSTTNADVSLTA